MNLMYFRQLLCHHRSVSNLDELLFLKAISHSIRNYRIPRKCPRQETMMMQRSNRNVPAEQTVKYGGLDTTMKEIRQSWLNFLMVMAINSVPGWRGDGGSNFIESLPVDEDAISHWDAFEHICEIIGTTLASVLFGNQTSVLYTMDQSSSSSATQNVSVGASYCTTPPSQPKTHDYLLDFVNSRKQARLDDWDANSAVIRLPSSSGKYSFHKCN